MEDEINVDVLAEVYIQMRSAKEAIAHEAEEKIAEIDNQMDAIEQAMNDVCRELGADSIKTKHGTIIRSIKERIWPANKEVFTNFIKESGEVELLELRVHQGNMKEFMKANGDELPPGLNIDRKYAVTVRRSK